MVVSLCAGAGVSEAGSLLLAYSESVPPQLEILKIESGWKLQSCTVSLQLCEGKKTPSKEEKVPAETLEKQRDLAAQAVSPTDTLLRCSQAANNV